MMTINTISNSLVQRNKYLDALKGVGIFLMIIGHVMSPIRNIVFSFHMPLFFFVSGYLYRDRIVRDILANSSRKVLFPYFITCIFIWAVFIIRDGNWKWGLSLFLANGTDTVWNQTGLMVGPLWFLICYVVSILEFHYVLKIRGKVFQLLTILLLWVLAYSIRIKYGLQPLDILNSPPAVCCLWMGDCLKDKSIQTTVFSTYGIVIGLIIWFLCLLFGSLSMAGFYYKLWVLQLVGAFYATWLLYKLLCIEQLRRFVQLFAKVGRLSLVVLCAHSVDYMLNVSNTIVNYMGVSNIWGIPLNMLFKLLFAISGTVLLCKIPVLRKVYIAG